MTTTPAPTDIDPDAIRARLLNATDGPWAIWPDLRPEGLITIGDATGVIPEGETWTDGPSNTVAHVYTEEDAEFIRHAPEDMRALLDELANARTLIEGYAELLQGQENRAERNLASSVQASNERDAAREELAKTRADVEKLTTALDIVALREIRQAADLAIAQREWKAWEHLANKAAKERNALRDRYEPTPAGTADAEAANPATTAEPADGPKATCGHQYWGGLRQPGDQPILCTLPPHDGNDHQEPETGSFWSGNPHQWGSVVVNNVTPAAG